MNPRALLATAAPGLFVFLWSTGFVGALGLEDFRVTGSGEFLFTLAWLTLVLSLGPATLLNALIRSGTATHVASLFYLAPPAPPSSPGCSSTNTRAALPWPACPW